MGFTLPSKAEEARGMLRCLVFRKQCPERGPQEGGMGKVALAKVTVGCGFRNKEEVEGNWGGEGRLLSTHGVKYLWLRKHVAGPWGQTACLSATLR